VRRERPAKGIAVTFPQLRAFRCKRARVTNDRHEGGDCGVLIRGEREFIARVERGGEACASFAGMQSCGESCVNATFAQGENANRKVSGEKIPPKRGLHFGAREGALESSERNASAATATAKEISQEFAPGNHCACIIADRSATSLYRWRRPRCDGKSTERCAITRGQIVFACR